MPIAGCHLAYGANMQSLAQNGNLKQFAGITKYLSIVSVSKQWDVNQLCGQFFDKFHKSNRALCGHQFDVSKIGTQRIMKTVTVDCGGRTDLYALVSTFVSACKHDTP